jgi:hypothetical protein
MALSELLILRRLAPPGRPALRAFRGEASPFETPPAAAPQSV